jgi:hypothetical protein
LAHLSGLTKGGGPVWEDLQANLADCQLSKAKFKNTSQK